MSSTETQQKDRPGSRPPGRQKGERDRAPHDTGMRRREERAAYLFVLPFLIVFVAMLVVPLAYSGYLSFFRQRLIGATSFVGLENYVRAVQDQTFLDGVMRMVQFLLIQVPIMLTLSLVFALILDSGRLRLQRFVRLSIFVPYAVPGVIAALMWGYLYGRDFGPFAQVARALDMAPPQFLSHEVMLYSIMNIVTWSFVGYNMIIIFAALRAIPTELYEAARVDGAGEVRVAWSIKIPAVRPALLLTTIFSVIGTFQLFNEPNILRSIAPNVIGVGYTPNLYAYNLAFIGREINYAAAIAFLLGTVIMAVSYVVQLSALRKERRS
ncbi:carbohydrate ABC transporter permease [Actinotalea sp. K2]|uniref:carbohydrate ABC transporter permease n=1 Tax=Actinotalea sp. K2 TaxID=2939438 RepID=UPI002017A783|nr:sugar ABC transporter permease [Actinotalea sp. K2]MCL3860835.1 sugar ABC transporter permease [Actinotalea sp. K2]